MNGRFFDANVAALSTDFTVITVDSRGHGFSGRDLVHLTMEQLGDDLDTVLKALDVSNAVLVGWSLGMSTVYNYVQRHGLGRVAGLVSVDMTAKVLVAEDWEHGLFGTLTAEDSLAVMRQMTLDRQGLAAGLIPSMFASGSSPSEADLAWWTDQSLNVPDLTALALWVSATSQDFRQLIAQIDVPILFAHGLRSQLYPTPMWETMTQVAKDGRAALFDSGHAPFWEQPEAFNEALSSFATEVTALR
jgi:pimeloyl-ACP methyl ester carboxylesterase